MLLGHWDLLFHRTWLGSSKRVGQERRMVGSLTGRTGAILLDVDVAEASHYGMPRLCQGNVVGSMSTEIKICVASRLRRLPRRTISRRTQQMWCGNECPLLRFFRRRRTSWCCIWIWLQIAACAAANSQERSNSHGFFLCRSDSL